MRRFLLLKQIYIFVEKNFSFMKRKIVAFLLFFIDLSLSAQNNIREEDGYLIINENTKIRKGNFLIINDSNSDNDYFSFIRKPDVFSLKHNIINSSNNFSGYNKVSKSKDIIDKKLKIESWRLVDGDYIITAQFGNEKFYKKFGKYKILLNKALEEGEIIIKSH